VAGGELDREGGGDVAPALSVDIGRSVKKFDGVKKNWRRLNLHFIPI
jgi:hypothetical protein